MPSIKGITWERLEAEAAVTYPSLSPEDPGQPIVFGDGFPREGGRARFTPASIVAPPAADGPTDLHQMEKQHIQAVLASVQGDKTQAAQLLGVSRRTLERRVAEWATQG